MTEERWLAVVGFEGQYEVSNLGRVRSLDRFVSRSWRGTPVRQRRKGVLLRPSPVSGYPHVSIGGRSVGVHTLVLRAFVGPCPEGHEALHGDGDRSRSVLENLRWGTPKENTADAIRHGTFRVHRGEAHGMAKLTEGKVRLIRAALSHGVKGTEIARGIGISPSMVSLIRKGKNWKGA